MTGSIESAVRNIMRIDIEDIIEVIQKRNKFNGLDLNNVELYENGEPLSIPSICIANFEATGLNNTDFISMRYWTLEKWRTE